MLKVQLTTGHNGKELHSYDGLDGEPVLVTTTHARQHGVFASIVGASGGTSTIIASNSNQGIVITDLIVNIEKANNASATVQIEDADGNGPIILAVVASDTGASIAIPFRGKFGTWQGAWVEVVAVSADANVTLGYFRTPEEKTMAFAEWDASR